MDFESVINYEIKDVNGIVPGDVLRIDTHEICADMIVLGFDDSNIPIVEYQNVTYKTELDEFDDGGDRFEDGDVFPYPFSEFEKLKVTQPEGTNREMYEGI